MLVNKNVLELPARQGSHVVNCTLDISSLNKTLVLSNGISLTVPISCAVSKDDELSTGTKSVYVKCTNGLAKIYPPYAKSDALTLGDRRIEITVKEMTTQEDLEGYEYLRQFHYRDSGNHFGRQTLLVAHANHMSTPTVGFVQISSPAILNKARALFLDTHFSMPGVRWTVWNRQTSISYSKTIAEIARIVVHPEYRNLGLGKKLLRHAFSYSKLHWQVGKMKPLFVEITADMLKFVPLPEKVGMIYVGDTEGNMHRLKSDLRYAFSRIGKVKNKDNCMERLQRKYLRKAIEILETNGFDKERLLFEISTLSENSLYQKYELLHGLLRMPKPVYMKGLTRSSQSFLAKRQRDLGLKNRVYRNNSLVEPLEDPIVFEDVTVSYSTSVPRTIRTSLLQESFGINPNSVETSIFQKLNLRILPRELVLVIGASGSGKTTLLKLVRKEIQPTEGKVIMPRNARFDYTLSFSPNRPVIEEIGNDFESSLCILNKVGLSDFHSYLLTYDQLSAGQRYRGLLAKLIDSEANLWILDDFLCNLDGTTQMIIANNIQRLARDAGITVIAACCDCKNFVDALRPDRVLEKDYGPSYRVLEGRESARKHRSAF